MIIYLNVDFNCDHPPSSNNGFLYYASKESYVYVSSEREHYVALDRVEDQVINYVK
jgi:hypothetical protein